MMFARDLKLVLRERNVFLCISGSQAATCGVAELKKRKKIGERAPARRAGARQTLFHLSVHVRARVAR